MKYINSILIYHKTRKVKFDLTENEHDVDNEDKYKQETFHFLFLLVKRQLNKTHTMSRVVWKQGTLRWFIVNHCHDRSLGSDCETGLLTFSNIQLADTILDILPSIHKSSDCLGTVRLCPWISDLLILSYNRSSETTDRSWIV